jgi:hypothetical protein
MLTMAVNVSNQRIVGVVPPNLPIAPTAYNGQHFDVLNNVLRLYFNQVSSSINLLSAPAAGVTASRPAIGLQVGQQYFDTTLGIPIWWDGSNWINASGTTV